MSSCVSHPRVPALLAVAYLVAVLSPAAFAQHGDVWMSTDTVYNKIAAGIVNEAGTEYTPAVHSLQVILSPDVLPGSPFDYSANDPGFRAAAGELPASQSVNLALHSLSVWNGSGLEPATGVEFDFDFDYLSSGFGTESNGAMHEHPLYGLTDLTADALPIPDGVYVAAFRIGTAGLGDSDLFRFVMLKDAVIDSEDDIEGPGGLEGLLEAYEDGGPTPVFDDPNDAYGPKDFTFFEDAAGYVASIPEPSSLSLAGCIAVALVARGKRRLCS
jgi:hypothetical protein